MTYAIGTRVRVLSLVGPEFERDWSVTGRIVRIAHAVPAGYHPVRFDEDGAELLIAASSLMPGNDQGGGGR